ncbi:MAG: hypothetical protein WC222_05070 [Parachlamydiales bacterium]|jgi:hypothetical protein
MPAISRTGTAAYTILPRNVDMVLVKAYRYNIPFEQLANRSGIDFELIKIRWELIKDKSKLLSTQTSWWGPKKDRILFKLKESPSPIPDSELPERFEMKKLHYIRTHWRRIKKRKEYFLNAIDSYEGDGQRILLKGKKIQIGDTSSQAPCISIFNTRIQFPPSQNQALSSIRITPLDIIKSVISEPQSLMPFMQILERS